MLEPNLLRSACFDRPLTSADGRIVAVSLFFAVELASADLLLRLLLRLLRLAIMGAADVGGHLAPTPTTALDGRSCM